MIDPATLAALLGVGIELVHLGQKVHELSNPKRKRNTTRRRNTTKKTTDGYAFVVQDVEYSRKFKIGSAKRRDDWLTLLNAKFPGQLEPILVIPTENAKDLERELNTLCATHLTNGDWFDLTEKQTKQLHQLQVVVDLGAGSLVGATSELDDEELQQARRLFELLSNASADNRISHENDETPDTPPTLDVETVPTGDYRNLPRLRRRSGYLLVIRNVEYGLHRIESTDYPFQYIGEVLGLLNPRFGLELILAFRSRRVNQLEENLSTLYPADDENGWRQLSTPQLQEIRNLVTREPVQGSVYVKPKTHWGLETVQTSDYKELPRLRYPDGYVCITQGVKPGKKYKIWHTTKPKDLAEDLRLALMLNNPHDATTSPEPVRFACVIKTKHATAFKDFLHKRYAELKQGGDWFDLDSAHLKEIRHMTSH